MVYKFFDKKTSGSGADAEPNYQFANELHSRSLESLISEKFIHLFRGNIWGADLADLDSFSNSNKGIKYLLCAIDLFGKYAWVVSLKDKRGIAIVNAFQKKIWKGRKPNKIWVDQGDEFYYNLFTRFLKINNIEMYSTFNDGKSVTAERFIWTLKNKIFKHLTAVSKNAYFDALDDIANKYNSTVHRTIKMKPIEVTSEDSSYAEYNEDSNEAKPKFKAGDHIRISKYKIVFAKGYTLIGQKNFLSFGKVKNTVPWTYAVSDLNDEPLTGSFYEKELQKPN